MAHKQLRHEREANRCKHSVIPITFSFWTSSASLRANQQRVWFAAVAYLPLSDLRRRALVGTELARTQCHTIRLKLLKIGAQVRVSVRRMTVGLASGYPYQQTFGRILSTLTGLSPQRCRASIVLYLPSLPFLDRAPGGGLCSKGDNEGLRRGIGASGALKSAYHCLPCTHPTPSVPFAA